MRATVKEPLAVAAGLRSSCVVPALNCNAESRPEQRQLQCACDQRNRRGQRLCADAPQAVQWCRQAAVRAWRQRPRQAALPCSSQCTGKEPQFILALLVHVRHQAERSDHGHRHEHGAELDHPRRRLGDVPATTDGASATARRTAHVSVSTRRGQLQRLSTTRTAQPSPARHSTHSSRTCGRSARPGSPGQAAATAAATGRPGGPLQSRSARRT